MVGLVGSCWLLVQYFPAKVQKRPSTVVQLPMCVVAVRYDCGLMHNMLTCLCIDDPAAFRARAEPALLHQLCDVLDGVAAGGGTQCKAGVRQRHTLQHGGL